ncbi:MAG: prepilin-type N-terminal cleavage/methylation domain-containing protein [Campylobacterota bacterium]|nr:prepilin-type N-terminal cleavage/methylation domain-containing protein [Campylobacterota bacterium]
MKRKAFTLIEISIVLVIIGIILAAVMKGRDLIKGSQIKEFNQVFVSQWETVAYSYYSRMARCFR